MMAATLPGPIVLVHDIATCESLRRKDVSRDVGPARSMSEPAGHLGECHPARPCRVAIKCIDG